jgi:hypothetical protein
VEGDACEWAQQAGEEDADIGWCRGQHCGEGLGGHDVVEMSLCLWFAGGGGDRWLCAVCSDGGVCNVGNGGKVLPRVGWCRGCR